MANLQSALGVVAIIAIAFSISEDRRAVAWRQAGIGLAVTFALALVLLKVPQVMQTKPGSVQPENLGAQHISSSWLSAQHYIF
jgi:nucleoside permease NupC